MRSFINNVKNDPSFLFFDDFESRNILNEINGIKNSNHKNNRCKKTFQNNDQCLVQRDVWTINRLNHDWTISCDRASVANGGAHSMLVLTKNGLIVS